MPVWISSAFPLDCYCVQSGSAISVNISTRRSNLHLKIILEKHIAFVHYIYLMCLQTKEQKLNLNKTVCLELDVVAFSCEPNEVLPSNLYTHIDCVQAYITREINKSTKCMLSLVRASGLMRITYRKK